MTRATAEVEEIILDPTHAAAGTLVSFKGVGWDLPLMQGYGEVTCLVDGEPVKIDRHCICNVLRVNGILEPVGTFVVANVSAGTYKIYITINMYPKLVGSKDFTVDAQAVPEFPSFLIMLPVILALTILLRREQNRRKKPSS
jgi:hypothetical protein